jgi:hypothetical protein
VGLRCVSDHWFSSLRGRKEHPNHKGQSNKYGVTMRLFVLSLALLCICPIPISQGSNAGKYYPVARMAYSFLTTGEPVGRILMFFFVMTGWLGVIFLTLHAIKYVVKTIRGKQK